MQIYGVVWNFTQHFHLGSVTGCWCCVLISRVWQYIRAVCGSALPATVQGGVQTGYSQPWHWAPSARSLINLQGTFDTRRELMEVVHLPQGKHKILLGPSEKVQMARSSGSPIPMDEDKGYWCADCWASITITGSLANATDIVEKCHDWYASSMVASPCKTTRSTFSFNFFIIL
jgi:hypothetical protein